MMDDGYQQYCQKMGWQKRTSYIYATIIIIICNYNMYFPTCWLYVEAPEVHQQSIRHPCPPSPPQTQGSAGG